MPKQTAYKITWSDAQQGYQLYHGDLGFSLNGDDDLQFWLSRLDTCSFCSATSETMTLRKERRERGGGYWRAYKRVGNKIQKKYLGKSSEITFEVLRNTARAFVQPMQEAAPPPPPRAPTLHFTKSLHSALQIYGFPNIPTKKALLDRYRELSKQHHPDVGGLHDDMVAVNLAYEYLKRYV